MYLSKDKHLNSGMKFFKRIRKTIKVLPKAIATDGNISYKTCIEEYYPNTTHVRFKKLTQNKTSIIER